MDQAGIGRIFVDLGDDRLVKAGGHCVDQFRAGHELTMLFGCDLAGYEDSQMPDAVMHRIDDRLTILDDLTLMVVEIQDPIQRLLRWRDVVAP